MGNSGTWSPSFSVWRPLFLCGLVNEKTARRLARRCDR
jgi:hypothetical protein